MRFCHIQLGVLNILSGYLQIEHTIFNDGRAVK